MEETEVIINDPSELNLSLSDLPEGWSSFDSSFNDREHRIRFKGQVDISYVEILESRVEVFPSETDAERAFSHLKDLVSKNNSTGNPKVADESFSYESTYRLGETSDHINFRLENVVAGVTHSGAPLFGEDARLKNIQEDAAVEHANGFRTIVVKIPV
jgi:hypothetical protein